MRRAACAPPPKIWISGSGSDHRRRRRRDSATAACRATRRAGLRNGERDRDRRVAAEARLVRRAVERDQRRVDGGLVERVDARRSPCAIGPRDIGDRARRRRGRRSAVPPSRRSIASREPRDAPAGAMARPVAPPASVTSASTVGRPRESQTRRACTPRDRRSSSRLASAQRDRAERASRIARAAPRRARARTRERRPCRVSSVRYSTGDLPSMRASSSPGSSAAVRASQRRPRLPARHARGRRRPARRTRERSRARHCGRHTPFSSRWLSTNARSNAGSPYHAHSASRITGPAGPIRMFFGLKSPCTSTRFGSCGRRDQRREPRARGPACARGGRDEVRLEANRVEDRVGRKARGDVRPVGGRRVDAAQDVADRRRPCRRSTVPSAQQRLPDRIRVGRQPGHRERAGFRGPRPGSSGTAAGHDAAGDAHPFDLAAVALDRRPPVGGDLELGQRALDANDARRQFDAIDVRRNAARQAASAQLVGQRLLSPFGQATS